MLFDRRGLECAREALVSATLRSDSEATSRSSDSAHQRNGSASSAGSGATGRTLMGDAAARHLYSNLDYPYVMDSAMQAHLLPLQQYILEQAKLSGQQ